jgi:hypothetical protein
MEVTRLLVSDAAKELGMNVQCLRLALQQNLFDFGVAVRTSEKRYVYYINETRLKAYLEGRDYAKNITTTFMYDTDRV